MTDIRITVFNTSEAGGTFLTPFWFGFHDGSFDVYDRGATASEGLERVAEDGTFDAIAAELTDADADGQGGVVAGAAGPIATGELAATVVDVDGESNGQLGLVAMILPSNDAFVGTGQAIEIFDEDGTFLGPRRIDFSGEDVLDAGTEVNTEMDAAFINQAEPDAGEEEGGVVESHPGFIGSEGNPDGDPIILGGTNAFGVPIDPVAADFTREGAEIASIRVNIAVETEGEDGDDRLVGNGADDLVTAGDGDDFVLGRRGYDDIAGEGGNDKLFGNNGRDIVSGGDGDDFIGGGRGADVLSGDEGADSLRG
ncbi:MAG: spondin domain-containing protein, partial [Pseudomonadota bacterium]